MKAASHRTFTSNPDDAKPNFGSLQLVWPGIAVFESMKSTGSEESCSITNDNWEMHGMSTSTMEPMSATAISVEVTKHAIAFELSDGRKISAPMAWFPRLFHATPNERRNWRLIGDGYGVHWPDVDEDVSVEGVLHGKMSVESPESLRRWLKQRDKSKPAGRAPGRRKK